MLTVGDVLQLEIFQGAEVVAGQRGLNRRVEWVHNVGVPDAPYWLNGGEFVLTTGMNLPSTPDEQIAYVRGMIEKNVAALAISVGRYVPHIPDYLHTIADEHDFPLIAVPYQARFVDIAREVNQTIAQTEVKQALNIHQELTRLILDGGDLKDLAVTLAKLVHQSVSIENDRFEAFANYNIGAVDEARRYTQLNGRTDPRLVRALEERGYLPQIRASLRPVHLPQMPDVGLEMERVLAPIVVHGEVYGFVWIIADDRPISDLERMAIESGSTIAALMLLRQESLQREEAVQRGDLLASLMQPQSMDEGGARHDFLTDKALRYGVDLRKPFRVMVVDGVSASVSRLYARVSRVIEGKYRGVLTGQFAGHLVLLAQEGEMLDALAQQVLSTLNDEPAASLGISAAHQASTGVASAYHESREAVYIARRLKFEARVIRFEALGYLHMLYRAGAGTLYGSPYLPALHQLTVEHQADLFHTLEVYLDLGGNGVAAAESLHIHRSTLNYRLARIAEICDADLSDPITRTNLQIALKLLRLFDHV